MNDFFRDKQVLVTGGGGFLGSHLCERLEAAGCRPFVPHQVDYDLTTKEVSSG
jgi:GDP-L-fucose synthase